MLKNGDSLYYQIIESMDYRFAVISRLLRPYFRPGELIDWLMDDKKESTGNPQGYFPPHSLRAYWRIGMCLSSSKENIESIASALSYQPKIQSILHMSSEPVSNAFIARWKDNKKMAFNAITDDAKINDYLYRAEGKLPRWVQIAIATRTLYGINYHRFCYIGNKIFCISIRAGIWINLSSNCL